jgi:O-antigen/teichoic acid export membrane protein
LLWITVPAATGIALVSVDAGFILGEGVRDNAVMVMPWIAFAGLINGFMTYYVHRAFMLSGQTQKFVWALILPVILNLGLNVFLIPLYGLMGAVWATIFSYVLAITIATILGRREYPLPVPVKAAFEVSVCSLLMAVTVLNLPLGGMTPGFITLLIKGFIGIIVYFFACWVINAADCRTFIRGLKSRLDSAPLPEPAE